MHSNNVTSDVPKQVEKSIEITFNNFSLSEEYRVNQIFKGFKVSNSKYNQNYTQFTRTYERVVPK